MDRLPPELCSEVFERVNWRLPTNYKYTSLSPRNSPLVLCQVCRHWRHVAVSTPALWCRFQIFLQAREFPRPGSEPHLDLFRLWLRRSAQTPLTFSFTTITPLHPSPRVFTFLSALVEHCARWQTVEFLVPNVCFPHIRGPMPLLTHATITPNRMPNDNEHFRLFDDAPALTNLLLGDWFMPETIHLPWTQITHIEAHCMYDYEFVLLLQLAENLVRFDAALIDSGGTPPEGSVTAPCLRDLRLSTHADAFTGWVVNVFTPNLTLPALETFVLVYPAGWLDTEVHCLREVFERSQCPLKDLRLPGSDLLDEWFKSLAIH